MQWYLSLHPVTQALLATLGTWLVTAAGASVVFFTRRVSQRYLDASLGMAAGVMIAASFWSLLAPAIEMSEAAYGSWKWVPPLVGFLLGAVLLRVVDRILPHLHPDLAVAEGPKTSWQRSTLLVLAITIHNIPEGLAVGVAFGAAPSLAQGPSDTGPFLAAVALAIGIGLQNFPEGTAVSLPLRREGMGRMRAFWYGQISAIVEPIAGVIGAAMVMSMTAILPYALAFAAGAMIFVVAEELIPESQRNGNVDLATMGCIVGFAIMMVLDVALG
ncbi:MAG: Zinc transporter ZupT [Planctomycetes bacterium ADurb.Bin126]|nr:MAG: Zinc transporter ZupT [Planctomycetes bacterium ADurb.Bin126]HOD84004.1 ZIP family metal transporter [Phycisphaerae bacterium]HQL75735.1 ZIP family metal transporter [Phycisphaerae bacterium]